MCLLKRESIFIIIAVAVVLYTTVLKRSHLISLLLDVAGCKLNIVLPMVIKA